MKKVIPPGFKVKDVASHSAQVLNKKDDNKSGDLREKYEFLNCLRAYRT